MDRRVEVELGGERLVLLPGRALWWPARSTLVLADLHLGKSQAFRASGLPVPAGVLDETLGRLEALVAGTSASRVLVVGDLLHAGVGLTDDLVDRVATWRRRLRVRLVVVPGNHDRALPRVAKAWDLEVAPPVLIEDGLAFVHEPAEVDGAFVWGGHLHPAIRLSGQGDAVKLPCFVIGRRVGVLPAFTRFAAGGGQRAFEPGAQIVAIAENRLIPIQSDARK